MMSTETKCKPINWHSRPFNWTEIIDVDGRHVATLHVDANQWAGEAQANMDLLKAAPDLLVALNRMLRMFGGNDFSMRPDKRQACVAARAAITKAKGE